MSSSSKRTMAQRRAIANLKAEIRPLFARNLSLNRSADFLDYELDAITNFTFEPAVQKHVTPSLIEILLSGPATSWFVIFLSTTDF